MITKRGPLIGALRLVRENGGHLPIIAEHALGDCGVDSRQACSMQNDVTDKDGRFSEFALIVTHRLVEIELAAVDEDEDAKRDHPLRAR